MLNGGMQEDEPIRLQWERVPDPTRKALEPRKPRWGDQPNPIGAPGNKVATFIVYAVAFMAWAVVMAWVRGA